MSGSWKSFAQHIKEFSPNRRKLIKSKYKRIVRPLYGWIPFTMPRLRLSHQLIGFFVVVVLFSLLIISFSIYSVNNKAVKKQISRFTEHTSESAYEELRFEMKWQQEQAILAGQYWSLLLKTALPGEKEQQARRFFKIYNDYEAIAFYDNRGVRKELFLSPKSNYKEINLPSRLENLPEQIDFDLDYRIEGKKEAEKILYSLRVALPGIRVAADSEVGAIVFLKRFPFLERLIKEKSRAFKDDFLIIDKNGIIIAGSPHLLSQKVDKEDFHIYQSLKPGVVKEFSVQEKSKVLSQSGEQDDATLEKVIIKISRPAWGLIIKSPYDTQRKYILRARAQSVGLVFLGILAIILLGFLYSRGINRNFRQLIKGIKALAEGNYSRKIRLITKSWTPYEIIYLTAEFNRMATKISTQWKQLERANMQLAKLDELKSNLIDTVSHELRTPLTNIKGYTSHLIRYENSIDSETRIKNLKIIKQQADRLGRLVEDLLVIPDLEREEGIRVFPDRVNLSELVNRSVTFIHEKANREIQVLQLPDDLDILVDPDRMEQVILNLLDNAIKYSLEDSVIELKAYQSSNSTVQIELFNMCDPIPSEEIPELFSKFKRLDERLTRTTQGTGLGLFITRGLVEAMGGSIRIDGSSGFRVIVEVLLFKANSTYHAEEKASF